MEYHNSVPDMAAEPAIKLKTSINDDLSMSQLNSSLPSSSPSLFGSSFRELSNREERFFDSQPWIDSDIEDYLSVNGDFTPLGGTTPLHQSSSLKNPQSDDSINISRNAEPLPESSPIDMKKQLIEFFCDGFSSDVNGNHDLQDNTEAKPVTFYLPSKCKDSTGYESINGSICSSGAAPNGYFKRENGKPAEPEVRCCFPKIIRCLRFSERKKRLNSAYNGCH